MLSHLFLVFSAISQLCNAGFTYVTVSIRDGRDRDLLVYNPKTFLFSAARPDTPIRNIGVQPWRVVLIAVE